MKDRGHRRKCKALIKKRLIANAIENYNRCNAWVQRDGTFIDPIQEAQELPKSGWKGIRRVLRHEGRRRTRLTFNPLRPQAEWDVRSLTYRTRGRDAARNADYAAWVAGDFPHNAADIIWEQDMRANLIAELLALLAHLSE